MLTTELIEIFQFELENSTNFDLVEIKHKVDYSKISIEVKLDFERHEFIKRKIDSLTILKFGSPDVITKEVSNSVIGVLKRLSKKCDITNVDVRLKSFNGSKYVYYFYLSGIKH